VGVFVNAKPADINSLRAFVRFDAAQLHGDETPDIVSRVASSLPVIKAFRVEPSFALLRLIATPMSSPFLLDGARAGQYGAPAKPLIGSWRAALPARTAIILSGGLKVETSPQPFVPSVPMRRRR